MHFRYGVLPGILNNHVLISEIAVKYRDGHVKALTLTSKALGLDLT